MNRLAHYAWAGRAATHPLPALTPAYARGSLVPLSLAASDRLRHRRPLERVMFHARAMEWSRISAADEPATAFGLLLG
jgi:hypothetical protein